ncbi:MAG: DUF4118 domain-containing protein [Proteobacteria bacterium]|nr:DUF4118 domain-containing protein [Pseudomonadota bacterium]
MTQWLRGETPLRWRDFAYAALIIVLASTFGFYVVLPLWPSKLPLMFFAAVLISGYRLGMWPAIFAAILAFLSFNFFFEEPRFTLTFEAEDLFALATFLVGALLVGGLTGRLSDHARQLKRALAATTLLFEASRDLATTVDPKSAAERVVTCLEANGCRAAIWLVENGVYALRAASARAPTAEAGIDAQEASHDTSDEITGERGVLHLASGGRNVGIAVVWPRRKTALPDARWMRALLDSAAVAIDRARLIAEIADARIVAEKEGLRTALLSSLSHDLRTPLSTILASATSLLEYDEKFDSATRRDLLSAIQDESERLNRYLANLLEMTRLESGALQVNRYLTDPRESVSAALRRLQRRLARRQVVREFPAECEQVNVDPVLLEQALVNVIENTVAHTADDARILARVENVAGRVRLAVEDDGKGIAPADLPHVFDKFFRGGGDRRRGSGIGLGLAVTRGLVEAFGGGIRAISPARDGHGARFEIDLPAHGILETSE